VTIRSIRTQAPPRGLSRQRGLSTQLCGLTSRGKFFAALFILGCINGLGSRIISSVRSLGWTDALLSTFGISVIVWISCFRGTRLILHERMDKIRSVDLVLGFTLMLPIALPIEKSSWFAITILSLYVLLFTDPSSSRRRGAVILLATTVPMLWSPLLFRYFANFILDIDALLISWLLGTRNTGNVIPFADHSGGLVIAPYCSSLANVSLAFLAWVTISQWLPRRSSPKDLYWCFLAAASVIAVNVTRIALMGLSQTHYQTVHSPWGNLIANLLTLGLTVGFCLLGVKREGASKNSCSH
jgi:exosortase/archaeosortase family protein